MSCRDDLVYMGGLDEMMKSSWGSTSVQLAVLGCSMPVKCHYAQNMTSCIWEYYGFYLDAKDEPKDITQPICKLCKRCVPVKDMLTANLFAQVQTHHPSEAAKLSDASTDSSTDAVSQNAPPP